MIAVRVLRKTVEAEGICSFELAAADGHPLPAFSAGSHIDVQVADGLTRQYSLCNDSAETHRYLIGVLREPASRGGSAAMHDRVQVGDVIQISAPKNHFALAHEAKRSLLLAGGIGITPILCMAERLAQTGADFEMHYCTRSPARTAFAERIRASAFADKVTFHHDDGDAAQKLDIAALLAKPEPGCHVYVCGPKGFMDAVLGTARAGGWPEAQLHFEFFTSDAAQPRDADEAFDVKLASSGRIVHVPKGVTVLRALDEAGVMLPFSCEQGVCGTCITRVIEGVPDHRDMYFTPEEQAANAEFTPCCSRSKTPVLVLDL
jgi:vanillate O-demethylase ferredoxin subunit